MVAHPAVAAVGREVHADAVAAPVRTADAVSSGTIRTAPEAAAGAVSVAVCTAVSDEKYPQHPKEADR